jgi:hypothetical protein
MRRGPFVPLLAVLTVLLSISVTAPASEAVWKLSIATDRPEAIYKVGEKGCFLVTLKKDGQAATEGEITYVLDKDGVSPLKRGKLKAANGPLVVEGTLEEPGFLRCFVSCSPAGVKKALTATAAAGFDPLKIPPSLPVPDDFDTFWAAQKARLAAVPLKPVLTPVKSTLKGIECFDVQVPVLDHGRFPAILPGLSVRRPEVCRPCSSFMGPAFAAQSWVLQPAPPAPTLLASTSTPTASPTANRNSTTRTSAPAN